MKQRVQRGRLRYPL